MDKQKLAFIHLFKQQLIQQQQQHDDMNAAKLLLNLGSVLATENNSLFLPLNTSSVSTPSSQATKILKPHPKFRAKVNSKPKEIRIFL